MRVKYDISKGSLLVEGLHGSHLVLLRLAEGFNHYIDLECVLASQLVDLREDIILVAFEVDRRSGAVHAGSYHI